MLAGGLAGAAEASAGTVEVLLEPDPFRSLSQPFGVQTVVYAAHAGERNDVSFRFEPYRADTGAGSRVTITDRGAPITVVGAGCARVDAHSAACGARADLSFDPSLAGLWQARASLGDLDDHLLARRGLEVDMSPPRVFGSGGAGDDVLLAGTAEVLLDGGGGQDILIGGPFADRLSDGDRDGAGEAAAPGPDLLDGGIGGSDTVDYSARSAPLYIALADGDTASGATGGDQLARLDNIVGGAGDDTLAGNDRPNHLVGMGGRDQLLGGGGADTLGGHSRLGRAAGDRAQCGPGHDGVFGPRAADVLDDRCETVLLPGRSRLLGPDVWSFALPARPETRPGGRLVYRYPCAGPLSGESCSGTIRIAEPTGRRRLLATGAFRRRRGSSDVALALTPLGRRLAGRRSGVPATLRVVHEQHDPPARLPPSAWTFQFKARGS